MGSTSEEGGVGAELCESRGRWPHLEVGCLRGWRLGEQGERQAHGPGTGRTLPETMALM